MKNAILAAASGTSVLTEEIKSAVNSGMLNLSATVSDVVLLAVPVTISVIALTAGVKYALKKVRGVISSAA